MTVPLPISIIMAVFNRLELTRRCLETLEASMESRPYEVIIVDDGSTDGTRDFLETLGPPYRVILNTDKGNFAINNNRGVAIARHDTLCLLNNDTELATGWLEPMLEGLERFLDAGCVGNVQKIPATERYDHFGICFPAWHTPLHFGQHFKKRPPQMETGFSRWGAVTAACIVMKKAVFESVGGFDETYINGCEDIDLCLRLHQKGHWHYVAHESEILHHKGASPCRKTHNNRNLEKLKAQWGGYLDHTLVPRDRLLAARSYLRSATAAPLRINGPKFARAVGSMLPFRAGPEARKQPECEDAN